MLQKMTIISYIAQLLEFSKQNFWKVDLFTSPGIKAPIHSQFLRSVSVNKCAN